MSVVLKRRGLRSEDLRKLRPAPKDSVVGSKKKKGLEYPSNRMSQTSGELVYPKGKIDAKKLLLSFDTIPLCERDACPVAGLCTYDWDNSGEQCGVLKSYVRGLVQVLYNICGETAGDKELLDIGLGLLPLYLYLGKLQLLELGVTMTDVTLVTNRGTLALHPIYREIREQLKAIEGQWRACGYSSAPNVGRPPLGGSRGGREGPPSTTNLHGDSDYYEAMGEEGEDND